MDFRVRGNDKNGNQFVGHATCCVAKTATAAPNINYKHTNHPINQSTSNQQLKIAIL